MRRKEERRGKEGRGEARSPFGAVGLKIVQVEMLQLPILHKHTACWVLFGCVGLRGLGGGGSLATNFLCKRGTVTKHLIRCGKSRVSHLER